MTVPPHLQGVARFGRALTYFGLTLIAIALIIHFAAQ